MAILLPPSACNKYKYYVHTYEITAHLHQRRSGRAGDGGMHVMHKEQWLSSSLSTVVRAARAKEAFHGAFGAGCSGDERSLAAHLQICPPMQTRLPLH